MRCPYVKFRNQLFSVSVDCSVVKVDSFWQKGFIVILIMKFSATVKSKISP